MDTHAPIFSRCQDSEVTQIPRIPSPAESSGNYLIFCEDVNGSYFGFCACREEMKRPLNWFCFLFPRVAPGLVHCVSLPFHFLEDLGSLHFPSS